MTRVLCLVQKPRGLAPNQRFRHEQWAPILEHLHGIKLEFDVFEPPRLTELLYKPANRVTKAALVLNGAFNRWLRSREWIAFDAVVVVREAALLGGAWLERSIVRRGIPLVYDFDDAIWLWSFRSINGLFALARCPSKVKTICRLADHVTVGSAHLAAFARRHTSTVSVVPTSIDLTAYPEIPPPDGPFRLVWTGSHSTLAHFELVRPVLEALARECPLTVRVVCDRRPQPLTHARFEFVPWRAETEAADLAASHVGLMPLPDTPASRGKCGCKALQYMAIGRPAVVSPVGVNRDIVVPGENGLWATTPDDWLCALRRLAGDPALRARMGRAARQTVVSRFSAASSAAAFAQVLQSVLANRSTKYTGEPRHAETIERNTRHDRMDHTSARCGCSPPGLIRGRQSLVHHGEQGMFTSKLRHE